MKKVQERRVWKEEKRARKKEAPTAYRYLIKIQSRKHNIVVFYEIWKKYNQIPLTKTKCTREAVELPN